MRGLQFVPRAAKGFTTVDIRDFGGVAGDDGSTDQSAAFVALIAAAPALEGDDWLASGLKVNVPAGTYAVDNVAFDRTRARMLFDCDGKGSTVFMRTANNPIFDVSGTADSAAEAIKRVMFRGCTVTSAQRKVGVWTAPLIRCYYSQFVHWYDVDFYRAGGSGIAGVRYYDAQFMNCRWDYCGAAGNAAIHMMCSEQGKTAGQFGYSTDSCNNLYFNNCTIEQCPSMIYMDGRQSDGSLNPSRRINLCRFNGVKVENQIDTERSDDALVKLENCAHTTIASLLCSANGTKSGNPTDWLHLKNTYNTHIAHYTASATEVSGSSCMRTALKLEATTGTKAGLIAASVQTKNKPTVAAVEFSGTNTAVGIDKAYYDNNPGSAALYAGTPTSWIGDQHDEQAVIPAWSTKASIMTTRALTAGTVYLTRFVPRKPMKVTDLKFVVTVAATQDDPVDVGIYNSDLASRLASSGAVTGKLNGSISGTAAIRSVPLTAPLQLNPGTVYYLAVSCGTAGGTQATITGIGSSGGITQPNQIVDTKAPGVEWTTATSSHPLPSSISSPAAAVGSTVALWAVTA